MGGDFSIRPWAFARKAFAPAPQIYWKFGTEPIRDALGAESLSLSWRDYREKWRASLPFAFELAYGFCVADAREALRFAFLDPLQTSHNLLFEYFTPIRRKSQYI